MTVSPTTVCILLFPLKRLLKHCKVMLYDFCFFQWLVKEDGIILRMCNYMYFLLQFHKTQHYFIIFFCVILPSPHHFYSCIFNFLIIFALCFIVFFILPLLPLHYCYPLLPFHCVIAFSSRCSRLLLSHFAVLKVYASNPLVSPQYIMSPLILLRKIYINLSDYIYKTCAYYIEFCFPRLTNQTLS